MTLRSKLKIPVRIRQINIPDVTIAIYCKIESLKLQVTVSVPF